MREGFAPPYFSMVDVLLMPTVRHTGSLFMVNLFRRHGFKRVGYKGVPEGKTLIFDHTYDTHMKYLDNMAQEFPTVVIPIRDPMACARGWSKRSESFKHFFEQWDNLLSFDKYDPFYIPLVHPEKDKYLDSLSRHIGLELKTEWGRINTSQNPLNTEIPDEVNRLYDEPVVNQFYLGSK